ncbi:hypothetical protein SSS_06577 [Sarcoptes scabiei]|uniref:Gustatory receptor n=1 Tax=Sarcoptes scabiei TaxID=52283 RepID=A0A834RA30_SARSC|nr:hypothetical protein SSS_06577 [Sarcoptes scabiei]
MEMKDWRPFRIESVGEIFQKYFDAMQKYVYRIRFTSAEYQRREMRLDFKRLRLSLWASIRAILQCLLSLAIRFNRNEEVNSSFEFLKEKLDLDIRKFNLIIFLCILFMESYWLFSFHHVINYRLRIVNVFDDCIKNSDRILFLKNRQHLINGFVLVSFIIGTIAKITKIILLFSFCSVAAIIIYLTSILHNPIAIIVIVFFMFVSIQHFDGFSNIVYVIMIFFSFTLKFYHIRFKELIIRLRSIVSAIRMRNTFYYIESFAIRHLNEDYVKICDQIHRINVHSSQDFMFMEFMFKYVMIFSTYQLQKYSISHFMVIVFVVLTLQFFLITHALYFMAAKLPISNQLYYQLSVNIDARIQFKTMRKFQKRNGPAICTKLKANTFMQLINENRVGLSCDGMYLLTKMKLIEIFSLNVVLNILIYKHFIR